MYFTFLIFITWVSSHIFSKKPVIIYKEYFVDEKLIRTDIYDKNPILDVEKNDVDMICCTYFYDGKIYKIIIDDFYDLSSINLKKRDIITEAYITDEGQSEIIDVTDIIIQHAGPYQDFHKTNRLYKSMMTFDVNMCGKMLLTIKMCENDIYIEL